MDYEVRKGDRIAQPIVDRLDDQDWLEVEGLHETERAEKQFGSSRLAPELQQVQPTISFLQADGNHQVYHPFDINQHPILPKEQVLRSYVIIAKASPRNFEEDFRSSVKKAVDEDQN